MGPWLTTKKRGRDDDAIEATRTKVVQARKRTPVARTNKKSAAKPRARPAKRKEEDDDEDSMDDFVVDDEEEVEAESDDDDDEEEVLSKLDKRSAFEDDSSEEEEEEEGTFFRSYKKRTSRPPPGMGKKAAATTKKKKESETVNLYDDDDDDSEVEHVDSGVFSSRKPKKRSAAPFQKLGKARRSNLASSSSDNDASGGSNEKAKKSILYALDSDDDDLPSRDTTGGVLARLSGSSSSRPATSRFFQAGTDTDATPLELKRKKLQEERHKDDDGQDQDDDDDDDDGLQDTPVRKATKKKKRVFELQDDSMDEDEAVALAMAMDASQHQKQPTTKTLLDNEEEEEEQAVELLDSSSDDDDDEQGGDEQDEYVTPEERAASSVLETANDLSAQVLQAMTKWSSSGDSSTAAVPTGMIVDGALTLASMSADRAATDHTWISNDVMKKILPDVTLADYQLIGVNWMALLHGMRCQVKGSSKVSHTNVNGVLADEMGLGKTVQTIAFLSWLRYAKDPNRKPSPSKDKPMDLDDSDEERDTNNSHKALTETAYPHLVVAPAAVLSNWEREFEKFAPHLHVVKYHGTQAERAEIQQQLSQYLPGKRSQPEQPLDVVLAPITYFQKEKGDDRYFLRKFRYDYMVVDEAHLLKNPKGTRYKSLDRFNTLHRLLLTGTPVQNSPQELMALLCFLMPLFSRKGGSGNMDEDDIDQVHDGGESMLQHFVSLESGQAHDDQAAYRKLKQLFAPFVLRRRKDDVLSQVMPPKTRQVEIVELEPAARERYDSILRNHLLSKKAGKSTPLGEHLFTNLRKAAHHQLLLRFRHTKPSEKEHMTKVFHQYGAFQGEGSTKERVAEELERYNDFMIHLTALELIDANPCRRPDLERYVLQEKDLFCSAKMVCLRQLLNELIPKGHRITIFSGWTSCLDLLGCLLEQLNLEYLRMEGSTPVHERQALIDRFNKETHIPIFLLSTRACGLGINLTAADVCIQHDLDFNIFNDLQAEDRIHRIGQTKPVKVIKLVAKDTVDEDIYAMQQRKAKMSAAIMENSRAASSSSSSKKDMEQVLKTAVDRFLKSPTKQAPRLQEKENVGNGTSSLVDVDEL